MCGVKGASFMLVQDGVLWGKRLRTSNEGYSMKNMQTSDAFGRTNL